MPFYISNASFNSACVVFNFFMNLVLNVAQVLLNTYKHHHTDTFLMLSIFVSMSRPRTIYVVSARSIFYFHFNYNQNPIKTSPCFLYVFKNMPYQFWMVTWMKKANDFQITKVQPQGVAQLLHDFLPISVWFCL